MCKKSFLLIICVLMSISYLSFGQQPAKTTEPIDSVKNKLAIALCKKLLVKDYSDPLYNKVSVFGNPDCGHCKEVEAMMKEKAIEFTVYDMRDINLVLSVQALIAEKEKTGNLAYGYPVIIYKGELYYNFNDANALVEELKLKTSR